MVRAFLIDVINDEAKEILLNDDIDIEEYYKYLNCRCFDIARIKINGTKGKKAKYFDAYVDDEGLLKDPQPPISAYNLKTKEPQLVGNIILAHHDSAGNTTSLSDDDIKLIKQNLIWAQSQNKPNGYQLVNCEYR